MNIQNVEAQIAAMFGVEGDDHRQRAAKALGKKLEEVSNQERKELKQREFLRNYGCTGSVRFPARRYVPLADAVEDDK